MPAFPSTPPNAMQTLTRRLLLALLAAAFAVTSALAAGKPARKEGAFGSKASGPYLTKEQLRGCMTQRDKMKADDTELSAEQAAIATEKAQIARAGDELKTRLETIDRTSAEAVDGYNIAGQARDKQIDAYQARVAAFNTRVGANEAAHSSFGQGCSNRRYFEEDEQAISKGK